MFDYVWVKCPDCHVLNELQSKAGDCCLMNYFLDTAPPQVLGDLHGEINRCDKCDCRFQVETFTIAKVRRII